MELEGDAGLGIHEFEEELVLIEVRDLEMVECESGGEGYEENCEKDNKEIDS